MRATYFTLEEANRLLPQIRRHILLALQLQLRLRATTDALAEHGIRVTSKLLTGEADATGPEADEVGQARALYEAMLAEVEAVQELGAEVKGIEQGLVDFRSWLDGKTEVLLCWKLGEPRIEHFHLPEAGFAGRRSVSGHSFLRQPHAAEVSR